MVKMLIVLVSTISSSQTFLLKKKMFVAKATHIYSAKILAYFVYLMIKSFNDTLTNH